MKLANNVMKKLKKMASSSKNVVNFQEKHPCEIAF